MHLCDAEPVDPKRPYWKAYKRRDYFFDDDFAALLEHYDQRASGPIELVLNGDIFDFDMVMTIPDDPPGLVRRIHRARGLSSEEWMSLYKIRRIIEDHPTWFSALGAFVERGHRAVFVTGNHDVELAWPAVQEEILRALDVSADDHRVAFAGSFYLSGGDTFISHGHLFDPYCTEKYPIDPMISVHGRPRVRIPFGDMANRYMVNGMGYFNPHASNNYIMSLWQYAAFFFRYMLRGQPFLLWTWFWSAIATLILSLRDYWHPPMRDPLLVDTKVQRIAEKAQATPAMVRAIEALTAPSACADPMKIAKELWLDRGFLFLAMVWVAWQVVLTVNWVWPISPWWLLLAIALLFPFFLTYSFKVRSRVFADPLLDEQRARFIHEITGATAAVMGHTHIPEAGQVGPIRYANGGFWSPAFKDPLCSVRIGTQTFVRLVRDAARTTPEVVEWPVRGLAPRPYAAPSMAGSAPPEVVAALD